jgi:hypothetical protein
VLEALAADGCFTPASLDLPIAPPSWSGTPVVSASAAAYVVVSE